MKYIIDEEKLYDLVDAEVSTAADGAYDKNGNPLFDGIILTEKDGDMVKRLTHDAASRLVGRMADIAKFSADVEETAGSGSRRLLNAKAPVLRASGSETILVDNRDWIEGLGAISMKYGPVKVNKSGGTIYIGYNNRYGAIMSTYLADDIYSGITRYRESNHPDWVTCDILNDNGTLVEVNGQTCFRFTFAENTGVTRKTKFWMFLNARDPDMPSGIGNEYFGISIQLMQFGDDDPNEVSVYIEKYPELAETHREGLTFSPDGGKKLIPIQFSDGSSVLSHYEAGDIRVDPKWTNLELDPYSTKYLWFSYEFTDEGILIDCTPSYGIYMGNNFGGEPFPYVRSKGRRFKYDFMIYVSNVVNPQSYDYNLYQDEVDDDTDPDDVHPHIPDFWIKQDTQEEFEAEGGTKVEELVSRDNSAFTLTFDNAAECPEWLTVNISSDNKKITYTCQPSTDKDRRKFWAAFTATKTGTGETAPVDTLIMQYPNLSLPNMLDFTVLPNKVQFPSGYDPRNVASKDIELQNVPEGYTYSFAAFFDDGSSNFYGARNNNRGGITIYQRTENKDYTPKTGYVRIYLNGSGGWSSPNDPDSYRDVIVTQEAAKQSSSEEEEPQIVIPLEHYFDPGPRKISRRKFEFGVNGGKTAFDAFWVKGGSITKVKNIPGGEPAQWFTLGYDSSLITADTDSEHYNQSGAYILCEPNTTGRERNGSIELTIDGPSSIVPNDVEIRIHQEAAEAGEDDTEHPAPVITCDSSITVPASNGDGVAVDSKQRVFLRITLEDADDYEVSWPDNSFIYKVVKYSDGVVIMCEENDGGSRNTHITITATNQYKSSTKSITVTQVAQGTSIEQDVYLKVDKDSFVVKSNGQGEIVFNIDTNAPYLDAPVINYYLDNSGDDWCQQIEELDGHYEYSAFGYANIFETERIAKIAISYYDEIQSEDISIVVTVRQLAQPAINLQRSVIDNYSWSGSTGTEESIPYTLVGIPLQNVRVSQFPVAVVADVDAQNRILSVKVTQNPLKVTRELAIIITGENELGETATATLTIRQLPKPQPTDSGGSDSGGSGDDTSTASGKEALEFEVPDFDLNELVGTAYNQEGVFKEISRYFVLFICMKLFQERYADLVPVYTERAQSAMDNINNIIRQRKRPKRK